MQCFTGGADRPQGLSDGCGCIMLSEFIPNKPDTELRSPLNGSWKTLRHCIEPPSFVLQQESSLHQVTGTNVREPLAASCICHEVHHVETPEEHPLRMGNLHRQYVIHLSVSDLSLVALRQNTCNQQSKTAQVLPTQLHVCNKLVESLQSQVQVRCQGESCERHEHLQQSPKGQHLGLYGMCCEEVPLGACMQLWAISDPPRHKYRHHACSEHHSNSCNSQCILEDIEQSRKLTISTRYQLGQPLRGTKAIVAPFGHPKE
mmetsp:Transcript_56249/g.131759  ORF Transcript_56249/g.131759 Transcript_56249/m.131759 type:complete len:260 (-) Transcript_56249:325-1104(-)